MGFSRATFFTKRRARELVRILALDIAEYRIGWARGYSGELPKVGAELMRRKDESTGEALERFTRWAYEMVVSPPRLDLVVAENYIPHGAMAKLRSSPDARDGAILFNGALRAVCALENVPVRCPDVNTVRVHFCGQRSAGDRDSTKRMVVTRAQMLGYLSRDCDDDDMADAAALFDFASSHFGRAAPRFALTEGGRR
jgi:hypothetical protein